MDILVLDLVSLDVPLHYLVDADLELGPLALEELHRLLLVREILEPLDLLHLPRHLDLELIDLAAKNLRLVRSPVVGVVLEDEFL